MKKEIIRREFFKLRLKQKSYSKCKIALKDTYDYSVSIRTLKRWQQRLEKGDWNLKDDSKRPKTLHYKLTDAARSDILALRKETGWGAHRLNKSLEYLNLSSYSINRVLREHGLTRKEGNRGRREKYIRFERKHPNTLWHIDDSEYGEKGKIIAVVDDCSRFCLGILHVNAVTTAIATHFLDELIKIFGKPSQIISDNGSPYGGKSKSSKFDRWCKRRNIKHIRTRVKRPQTNGKVERLFGTIAKEISFCKNDLDYFRFRYNHFRPHQSLSWKTPSGVFDNFQKKL